MSPRTAIVVANERAPHHLSFGASFLKGLLRLGWKAEMSTSPKPCDLLVMWGVRRAPWIAQQRDAGGEVCILERGYLGDRFQWTSVSFGGGLNGRGQFRTPAIVDGRRLQQIGVDLEPWKVRKQGHALLIGQVPGDQSLKHINTKAWYADQVNQLRAAGCGVIFRPHPGAGIQLARSYGIDVPTQRAGTLADGFVGARLCVTMNSNAAVDAVIAGVPTVATDEGSMAWGVTSRSVNEILTPDRADWANRLAWSQWLRAEMETGYCGEVCGL